MTRIITYDDFIIEQDDEGRYFYIDLVDEDEEMIELELIKSIPSGDLTEDELLDVDFDYFCSGESDDIIGDDYQYMYFIEK